MQKIKIGIIGAGRVVEEFYLPVLAEHPSARVECLVDINETRTRDLSGLFRIPYRGIGHASVIGKVDAAIVATPHHLHSSIARDLLDAGVPVLVEKPMALSETECRDMNSASERSGAVLAVGQIERFYENSKFIKKCIKSGIFGRITSYECERGYRFDWDVVSDFQFRREYGGGVLCDIGVHAIDQLIWWFEGVQSVTYQDNACGGVETDCVCELHHESGVEGRIELSRTRNLRNRFKLFSDRGIVVLTVGYNGTIHFYQEGFDEGFQVLPLSRGSGPRRMRSYFSDLVDDFLLAIEAKGKPWVTGNDAIRAVRAIEQLKGVREDLEPGWNLLEQEKYEALQ